jgi:hypothetical protein
VPTGSSNLYSAPMLQREDRSTPCACSQVVAPFPNATQVSINRSKETKVYAPLAPHVTIARPRCSCSHPNFFILPTDNFFLVLCIHSFVEYAQGVCTLSGFHGRPYILYIELCLLVLWSCKSGFRHHLFLEFIISH